MTYIDTYIQTKTGATHVLTESSAEFIPSIQLTFTQLY